MSSPASTTPSTEISHRPQLNRLILSSGIGGFLVAAVLVLQINQQSLLDTLLTQQKTFSNLQNSLSNQQTSLATQQTALSHRVEQFETLTKTENDIRFQEMRQQLDDLVTSGALFPNKSKPAKEALELAKSASTAGNKPLAKVFYLSAINHAPSEFSILKDYAKFVLDDDDSSNEDLQRLKSVLQVSLYQVPPANTAQALELLKETIRKEEQLQAATTPKSQPINWQDRFDQITTTFELKQCWNNPQSLGTRLKALIDIQDSLSEEQPEPPLLKRLVQEIDLTQRTLNVSRLRYSLDTILSAFDPASDQQEKAASILQTAEATLSQFWGIELRGLPSELLTQVDLYPKKLQQSQEAAAKAKSQPFVKTVETELQAVRDFVAGTPDPGAGGNQKVIRFCNEHMEVASTAAQQIVSFEERQKATVALDEIRNTALDAKRRQFNEYQKWVVGLCRPIFKEYTETNFTLSLGRVLEPKASNTLSTGIFKKSRFETVDQSLLAPETGRLFNDVFGKLTAKMDEDGQFQTQRTLAETTKKKLEEF